VDLTLAAALAFPDGTLGLIDCSCEQPFRCSYELVGTTGLIEVPDAYLPPERPIARLKDANGALVRELAFDGANQYGAMVDAFGEAALDGGGLAYPAEDGVDQMAVLDAILASAR
ncbi:MAG: gfo/Idh/MocA family oxidoreductase, partial [Thermoleophilia bacterium]|nr:gfo/Idh/MocA family oxidoreductase [Thermoleophilia bacterium]